MKTDAALALSVSSFFFFLFFPLPSLLLLPFTFSSLLAISLHSDAILQGRCSRKFCWRSRNGFSGVYFWIRRPYLLQPLSPPSFAKSVITMRPVRSTFTLIYPKRGAVAQSRAQKREGIRFLYKLSTNFSKNTFIHSCRLPSVWSLFYPFATFGAMHVKTFPRASPSVIHFHQNCFSLWFL